LVAAALCEGLLRVFGAKVLPRPDLYLEDPVVGKRLRPGWTGDEFGAPVAINSKGLRNRETPYEKPAGVYRILALGDSWTFGFRMAEPDAYPRQLERLLRESLAARGDTRTVEVINTGVVGYSTDQEAAFLTSEGWKYQPDLVLVNFYPVNDTHNKLYKHHRRAALERLSPWLRSLYEAPSHLYLRQFIKGARRTLKEKLAKSGSAGKAIAGDDWSTGFRAGSRGWEAVRTALQQIGGEAKQAKVPVLFVLLPDTQDLTRYGSELHPKIEPMVAQAASEAGLDYFDLAQTFEPWAGKEDEILFRRERHPNAKGYGIIAGAVAGEIERRYLGSSS
jgi:lysophospholipase L1-like esterase